MSDWGPVHLPRGEDSTTPCTHDGPPLWLDISTFDDCGQGVTRFLCQRCGHVFRALTVPEMGAADASEKPE